MMWYIIISWYIKRNKITKCVTIPAIYELKHILQI